MAVLRLTSLPNLKDPSLSFTNINGTFLDVAMVGTWFVSHRGLQSAVNSIAYIIKDEIPSG